VANTHIKGIYRRMILMVTRTELSNHCLMSEQVRFDDPR